MKKAMALLLVFSILLSAAGTVWAEERGLVRDFSDILEDYWGKETVDWAIENGLVDGFPDGTFRPEQEITLAEWATFIYRLNKADEWYTEELATRYRMRWYFGWDFSSKVERGSWYYKPMSFYIAGFGGRGTNDKIWNVLLFKTKELDIDPNFKMKRWMIITSIWHMHRWYGKEEMLEGGGSKILAPKDLVFGTLEGYRERAEEKRELFKDAKIPEDIDLTNTLTGIRISEGRETIEAAFWQSMILEEIYQMSAAGFVKGMPDGTLRPNQVITRIEALEFLRRVWPYLHDVQKKINKDL